MKTVTVYDDDDFTPPPSKESLMASLNADPYSDTGLERGVAGGEHELVDDKLADAITAAALTTALIEEAYGKRASERQAAQWVFDNLVNPNPRDPPSVGAVGLLMYARKNEDKFYGLIWPKLMPTKQQIDAAAERGESSEKELDRLLKDALEEARSGRPMKAFK